MSDKNEIEEVVRRDAAEEESEAVVDLAERGGLALLTDRRRIVLTLVAVLLMIVAIYFLLPKVIGFQSALGRITSGNFAWLALGVVFTMGSFFAYVALFRGVVGESVLHLDWRECYQITMAGLAASLLFSAAGAGGLVLTYWALRKAGMERRQSARRMVAFLVLLYTVYMVALVLFGVLLRTGVLSGQAPLYLTIVPAGIAGLLIVLFLLTTLIPADFEKRLGRFTQGYRRTGLARRLATVPAVLASGTRMAIALVRHPRGRGWLAVVGALGYWAGNVGTLWASFHAFDVQVPFGVVVMGFFVGMAANLFPFAPAGVGAVDAGMIGTFVLFGLPDSSVFAAVLAYRLIAFWMPIPPGIIAFIQLRRTVQRWEVERPALDVEAHPAAITS